MKILNKTTVHKLSTKQVTHDVLSMNSLKKTIVFFLSYYVLTFKRFFPLFFKVFKSLSSSIWDLCSMNKLLIFINFHTSIKTLQTYQTFLLLAMWNLIFRNGGHCIYIPYFFSHPIRITKLLRLIHFGLLNLHCLRKMN